MIETSIFVFIWQVIKSWYWVLPPFVLLFFSIKALLWWRREQWEKKQKYILLEIIPPKEVLQTFQAMEQIFSSIWGIHSSIEGFKNLGKKWGSGKKLQRFSLEIIGLANKPHMLIRCFEGHEETIRAALYAQFPELEIVRVEDYINFVPQNIPNEEWDMYGFDEVLINQDVYPIKTFDQFFEKRPESIKEEKRIDPLNTLLEGIDELKPGEQIWVQINVAPVSPDDNSYLKRGRALIERLTHRREGKNQSSPQSKEDKGFVPPEMKLTAREREVVNAIETKISKQIFEVGIRCIYLAKRSLFKKERKSLAEQFFTGLGVQDLNGFKKWRKTKTRVYFYHLFGKSFNYLKKRQIFKRYLLREAPLYPKRDGIFILNTEELATIFHLPFNVEAVGTYLPRVSSRKGEAPAELPTEGEVEERSLSRDYQKRPSIAKKTGEPPPELPT